MPDFQIPNIGACLQKNDGRDCFPSNLATKYLSFLNSGGSPRLLIQLYRINDSYPYFYQDVTGDGVPELMLYDSSVFSSPHIYYCEQGHYRMYDALEEYGGFWINFGGVQDLNADNIPEILFTSSDCSGVGCFGVSALEWNGDTFQDLSPTAGMWGVKEWHVEDGKNGTKEIVLSGDRPGACCYDLMIPWRLRTDTYAWDGKTFSLAYETFAPAQYRYQAVQDGDREVRYGNYDNAMQLYRNVIFNDKLEWWSADRKAYLFQEYYRGRFHKYIYPQVLPPPSSNYAEYPRLAAYAYYRIMLLQIVQGRTAEAAATYATLQQDFGKDPYGQPYVQMATAFWDTYRSTSSMYDGCAAAIGYAAQHPEILDPLNSGSLVQDHYYKPADVCPFR